MHMAAVTTITIITIIILR